MPPNLWQPLKSMGSASYHLGSNQVSPSLAVSLWVVCVTEPQFSHLENGGNDGNNRASLINHHHEIK